MFESMDTNSCMPMITFPHLYIICIYISELSLYVGCVFSSMYSFNNASPIIRLAVYSYVFDLCVLVYHMSVFIIMKHIKQLGI